MTWKDSRSEKIPGSLAPPGDAAHHQTGSGTSAPNPERAASASENVGLRTILQSIAKISNLKFASEIRFVHTDRVEKWQMEEMLESGLGELWTIMESCFAQRDEPWIEELKEKWGEGRRETPLAKSPHGMDLLGKYIPSEKKIVIYDKVCHMVCQGLRAQEKDLVTVVLAHEAAHAVTHLGEDLQGHIWDGFEIASKDDVELFAQIYDLLHLKGDSDPGLERVFRDLSAHQSSVYNSWISYDRKPIDEINDALIEARQKPPSLNPPSPTPELIEEYLSRTHRSNLRSGTQRMLRYIEELEARMENPDWVWERGYRVVDVIREDTRQWDNGDLSEFNANIIPRRKRDISTCTPILVVIIGFGRDGWEARVREAAKHVSEDCVEVTRSVIFWTTRWDSVKWIKYAESFQDVVVYLKLLGVEPVQLL